MDDSCSQALEWLAAREATLDLDGDHTSAACTAHFAGCEECHATLTRYRAFKFDAQSWVQISLTETEEERLITAIRETGLFEEVDPAAPLLSSLEHVPTQGAEAAFLAAARKQQNTHAPRRFTASKLLLAVAAAALLLVGGWAVLGSRTGDLNTVAEKGAPELGTEGGSPQITSYSGQTHVNHTLVGAGDVSKLPEGARLRTDIASHLQFAQSENAQITMSPETEVQLTRWNIKNTQLHLYRGTVLSSVVHRAEGESFEIVTENAKVIVVGTEFSVTYTPDAGTVVRGTSGTVRVEDHAGVFIGFVRAGQTLRLPVGPKSAPAKEAHEAMIRHTIPAKTAPAISVNTIDTARRMLADGHVEQAIATIIDIEDPDWKRDALLGDAYLMKQDHIAAEQWYVAGLQKASPPPESLLTDLATLREVHLNNPASARQTWLSYLQHYSNGLSAPRGHLQVATLALSEGDWKQAQVHLWTLLGEFPNSAQSVTAITLIGGHMLKARRWQDARIFFTRYDNGASPKAEAAAVGLIRVHIALGETEAAMKRIAEHPKRFNDPRRAHEIERMHNALIRIAKEQTLK